MPTQTQPAQAKASGALCCAPHEGHFLAGLRAETRHRARATIRHALFTHPYLAYVLGGFGALVLSFLIAGGLGVWAHLSIAPFCPIAIVALGLRAALRPAPACLTKRQTRTDRPPAQLECRQLVLKRDDAQRPQTFRSPPASNPGLSSPGSHPQDNAPPAPFPARHGRSRPIPPGMAQNHDPAFGTLAEKPLDPLEAGPNFCDPQRYETHCPLPDTLCPLPACPREHDSQRV